MPSPSETRPPAQEGGGVGSSAGNEVEAAPAKRAVKVTIYNQTYTLVTSGNPVDVEDLARIVDELVSNVASKAGNVDTARAAVLSCLHLADKVRNLEKDLSDLRGKYEAEHRRFTGLLDQALDPTP